MAAEPKTGWEDLRRAIDDVMRQVAEAFGPSVIRIRAALSELSELAAANPLIRQVTGHPGAPSELARKRGQGRDEP